ncbi:hypothetical protein P4110_03040 [Pseudomonas aeruginosa]|nr:hypothetical protein [Pseudomonas aeruginosa]
MTAAVWLDYTSGGDTMFAGLGAGIGARYTRGSDGTDTAVDHFTIRPTPCTTASCPTTSKNPRCT